MLTIIDKYILKRYLATFAVMLLLFIPIGIVVDVSEKINKMLENKVAFLEIALYYYNFTIYFANSLFPIFLFLSVIWFTSKLANDTEIIAILSSGISFTRFLRPYIIGASIVSVFVLLMGFFVVPAASEGFNNFRYTYLKGGGKEAMRGDNTDVYRQISDDEFIYVNSFNAESKTAFSFSLEKFKNEKLVHKITATRIKWNQKDSTYTMYDYTKRTVGELNDKIEKAPQKDAVFTFDLEDLTPVVYIAETLSLGKLNAFIKKERERGSSNINVYLVVLYKKYSVPVSAFILTIIAVAVSAMKRRGGMGTNLAIGIALAFAFVFFDKIFGVLAEKSSIPPMLAVWLPNIAFGILAIYLLRNAKR
ncbi:MAG: LptF/LptG family permease [Flavobacterium sp.]|jgi:lipopolysaccharide export system permease protein|uniref:LptF/LptG family permease n=1 Tax=Flavobacterium TaxID=237 RepID=UPI000C19598C|nr:MULTISPECIES: LptF/LptG family permease [Flavobacterium]MDI5887129.1 LptF/LptG family permease [Flavobacterium yafengii]MDP3679949.1 LptF/LptG family permease [Flavobacterium sp.]MDZ4329988.1 LptF/LptG family permease [Flavobacterium sp.]PIF63552.1 lipopolysaccharide export system permease protein [Flavobacterium sp. 11]RKS13610.1 lipopolysaccharide export system permease protein [Flavobacterium sp. 120]